MKDLIKDNLRRITMLLLLLTWAISNFVFFKRQINLIIHPSSNEDYHVIILFLISVLGNTLFCLWMLHANYKVTQMKSILKNKKLERKTSKAEELFIKYHGILSIFIIITGSIYTYFNSIKPVLKINHEAGVGMIAFIISMTLPIVILLTIYTVRIFKNEKQQKSSMS